jgi:hypothetical protein
VAFLRLSKKMRLCCHNQASISLPSKSFAIHHSPLILPSEATLISSLNKQRNERVTVAVGRAIARAVSPRVRAQVRPCGICGEQSGNGAGFLSVFWFSLPILIPPTAPHSPSLSSGAGIIGQLVADVPTGLTPQHGLIK